MKDRQQLEGGSKAPITEVGVVLLTSGQLLKLRGITLYPVEMVSEITKLREIALSKIGGVSSGIGFLGSPGWAIGAGAALGLIEGALSSSARKKGFQMLLEADQKHLSLRRTGRVFPFGRVINRDQPNPNLWRVEDDGAKSWSGLKKVEAFVHDGGEFFTADTETGLMNIRWQSVVAYTAAPN